MTTKHAALPAPAVEATATLIALPLPAGPAPGAPSPSLPGRFAARIARVAASVRRGARAGVAAPRRAVLRGRGALTDAGMATAEYAIATLAAVGFAGLLLVVLRSGEVKNLLTGLIKRALSVSG